MDIQDLEIPERDSQFILLSCPSCQMDGSGYEKKDGRSGELFRVFCPKCGNRSGWFYCRHDAQQAWNKESGYTEARA